MVEVMRRELGVESDGIDTTEDRRFKYFFVSM
jgi:hypothetical protein